MELFSYSSLLAVLLVLLDISSMSRGEYCHSDDENPYRFYDTKTLYDEVRGYDVEEEDLPGCEPVAIYLVARHGARYSNLEFVEYMHNYLPSVVDHINDEETEHELCPADKEMIGSWEPRMALEEAGYMCEVGMEEMRDLARRFQQRYPDLLTNYVEERFEFRHTNHHRTRDSAHAFAEGLFGTSDNITIIQSDDPDWLLRFYTLCDRYQEEILNETHPEVAAWVEGPELQRAMEDIVKRLGLYTIELEEFYSMWETCRSEHLCYDDVLSPWCASLEEEHAKYMEYFGDLLYYWTRGYGEEICYEIACPLVVDTLAHFQDALDRIENGREYLAVATRFAHGSTISPYWARLGLFKDDIPPRADNFEEMADRQWRTSFQNPMSGNIAYAFYRCNNNEHQVKAFFNDEPIVIPGCPEDEEFCPYETLQEVWGPIVEGCDVEEMCALDY